MSRHFEQYGELFQVDAEHFDEFYSTLKKITLKKSDFFLQSGEKCQYLGFVKKGTMRSYYINENGDDISFIFHFDNQFFADYESILCNSVSYLNIQAMEDSELLLLDKNDLQNLYEKEMYWQKFGRLMTEKIYLDTKKRLENLLYYSPEKRYTNLLEENPLVFEKIPQKYIAGYLGITPQSLSRIRKRIRKH
jgi:CRP-like cAMP-binding protein